MPKYILRGLKVRKTKKRNGKWGQKALGNGNRTGWKKEYGQIKRRKLVLDAHKNDALASARSMQALANISQDVETRRKAGHDAAYFYRLHRNRQVKNLRRKNGQNRGR